MVTVVELDEQSYADALREFEQRSLFHSVAWQRMIAGVYGVRPVYWGLVRQGRLVGLLPLAKMRRAGIPLLGAPLPKMGTPRYFPLLRAESQESALQALDGWARAKGFPHLQIHWPQILEAGAVGGRIERRDNLELAIGGSLDDLWKGVKSSCRTRVRHAVREGVRLHWPDPRRFLPAYLDLLRATYEAQGLSPNLPLAHYEAAIDSLADGHLRLLCASWQGRPVAAAWLLHDDRRCYFWDGASLPELNRLAANNLLQWEIIRWAWRRGLAAYDMVGGIESGRGGSRAGIGRFKQSFGSSSVAYSTIYWQRPWVKPLFQLYRRYLERRDRVA